MMSQQIGDLISRQAVLDLIKHKYGIMSHPDVISKFIKLEEEINDIHPVTPTERIGHWIPVSERLPEDNGLYLVYTEEQLFVCSFENGEFFIDDVLAWMPLPKPYEPQESEEV